MFIRNNTRFALIASLSLISIATYLSVGLIDLDYKDQEVLEAEIRVILQGTPNLWRKFAFTEKETVSSRVENQKIWIKKLSRTDYIKTAVKKTILVQDGMGLYYQTQGRLLCPYAPEFEDKCELVQENWLHLLLGSWKYNGISAVIGVRNWDFQLYEPLVPHHVKQVLYILEPPYIATNAHLGRNNALIASYWKGSDIPVPYRRYISNSTKNIVDTRELDKIIKGKTKMVAALISNCKTPNNRLGFIKELQKYVEVDVYGKCGNFSCPKDHQDCMSVLKRDYKFYLSIENSNCADYITEKFFDNALKNDLVPIVMGAHPNSYRAEAPPHSYIHVDEFGSPSALADYLNLLNREESLYKKYFEWKWKDMGYFTSESMQDLFCRLCGMLYYADFVQETNWKSTGTTWDGVNYCLPQGQWYWK